MLNWRSDFGLAGYFEKDTLEELIQLEFSEGFCSNPDCGSFEKLSCTSVPKEFLESEYTELPLFLQGSPLLPPFSMAFVLVACFKDPSIASSRTNVLQWCGRLGRVIGLQFEIASNYSNSESSFVFFHH